MKNTILLLSLFSTILVFAQSANGKLTLNGKSEINLEFQSNSVMQLLKEFKKGKYELKLDYEANGIPKNLYNETIVLFDCITILKKDGKLVEKIRRKRPLAYFPGEEAIPVEAFDFTGSIIVTSWDDMEKKDDLLGVLPGGKYTVELMLKPVGVEGEIKPLAFNFLLRKRPGRTKY